MTTPIEALKNAILTSVYGRRLGLAMHTTGQSGASVPYETLQGPAGLLNPTNTGESTSVNLPPYGVSNLKGSSAASSSVFTLDPPIPGITKWLNFPSTGDTGVFVKTANSEIITSTVGTSFTVVKSTVAGILQLVGITTGIWAAVGLTSGTSSNASGFTLSTTT